MIADIIAFCAYGLFSSFVERGFHELANIEARKDLVHRRGRLIWNLRSQLITCKKIHKMVLTVDGVASDSILKKIKTVLQS